MRRPGISAERDLPPWSLNRRSLSGNTLFEASDYFVECCSVVLVDVLNHQGEILALAAEMLGKARIGLTPGPADVKIGYVPVFDEIAEGDNRWKFFKLG